MLKIIFRGILFLVISACQVYGQIDSAQFVYTNYMSAIGGQENLNKINSIRYESKNNFNGMKTKSTIYHLKPNIIRTEIYRESSSSWVITCLYPDSMLIWDKSLGEKPVHTWQATEKVTGKPSKYKKNLDKPYFFNSLIECNTYKHSIKYLGRMIKLGKECFVIQVNIDEFTKNIYYIDSKTFYLLMTEAESSLSDTIRTEIYEDYKKIGELLMAFKVKSFIGKQFTSINEFESIVTNIPIDPRLFECVPLSEKIEEIKKD